MTPRPATRADILATLAIVSAVVVFAALYPLLRRLLSPHPTPAQCAELLDRYVDHVAHAVDPKPSASALAERRSLARTAAQGRAAFSRCTGDLTLDEVSCAMSAESADSFERCLPAR